MEKRLLIAFLLSMMLIMAYQVFYYGPRMKEAEERRQAELELQAQRSFEENARDSIAEPPPLGQERIDAAIAPPPEGEAGGPERVDAADISYVTVSTPLFWVTLSTAGGDIVGVTLKQYATNGDPVEILGWNDKAATGAANLVLVGENESLPLSRVLFEAYRPGGSEPLLDGTEISLDGSVEKKSLVFRAVAPGGGIVERTYTFRPDQYVIRAGIRYTAAEFPFARQISWGLGPGLRATEKNVDEDYRALRARTRLGDEYHKEKRGNFSKDFQGTIQWASLKTKYFTAILLPETPGGGNVHLEGVKDRNFMTASIKLPAAAKQGRVEQSIDLYMGPLDYDALKGMGRGLEKNVDIGFENLKIFQLVSKGILWCLLTLYKVIPNYGLVIILISVFTKVLFYRLTHKSFKSMADMQALQPRLQALKEKYKDDRQRLSQETMKLYKESGVNPLGGCLPMLLQMPVFLALFNVLRNTIELRRAPFFAWIDDLSQQDILATLPISLPIVGDAVSVLPILMGVGMLLQSKIGGGIAGPTSSATQPKMMMYMMPIVFTVLFYKMPSGLVLYWLVNTVLSIAQQYYINKGSRKDAANQKEIETETETAPAEPPKADQQKPPRRSKKNSKSNHRNQKAKRG